MQYFHLVHRTLYARATSQRRLRIRMQTARGQKLILIEIQEPAAGTQPATVDARAALKLRTVLARSEAERAELWRQVCSGACFHASPICRRVLVQAEPLLITASVSCTASMM